MLSSEIKKGAENLAADHLSRLENPHQDKLENKEITETFPLETLGSVALRVDSTPWFADFANYYAGNFIVKGMSSQQKNKFFKDVKTLWEGPLLVHNCCGSNDPAIRMPSCNHPSDRGNNIFADDQFAQVGENRATWSGQMDDALGLRTGCPEFLKPLVLAVFVLRSQELHNPQLHLGIPIS
ncbi:hypothetical protein Tco_0321021 [Tanacetum coccineum]